MADMPALVAAALKAAVELSEAMLLESERVQPGNAEKISAAIERGASLALNVEISPATKVELKVQQAKGALVVGSIPLTAPMRH